MSRPRTVRPRGCDGIAGKQTIPWPSDEEIVAGVEKFGTVVGYAHELGRRPASLDAHIRARDLRPKMTEARAKWQASRDAERPQAKPVEGGGMELTSTAEPDPGDIEDLLRSRNLDPADWVVTSAVVNEWEAQGPEDTTKTLRQLKVRIVPLRLDKLVLPAREPAKYQRPVRASLPKGKLKLVVFCGDQQVPYHDPDLHRAFCSWLERNQPDEGILMGDTLDLPSVSKHRHKPEWAAAVQECVDAGYLLLRDYVQSSERTAWKKLEGNHDARLRMALLDYLRDLHGLRRAQVPGESASEGVLSVGHLLRLDELGIEYAEPAGSYEHEQVRVSERLAARHGWIAKKGAGATALSSLEHLGHNLVIGHCHRQGIVHKTRFDLDGTPSTLVAAETGTMAQIRGGLGYAVNPDWQNGFATAVIWPDGTFRLELATWAGGVLFWRDQRISASRHLKVAA